MFFCKGPVALSFFTDWAHLRSCFLQSRNLQRPQTVETELALELEKSTQYCSLKLIKSQKKHQFVSTSFFLHRI